MTNRKLDKICDAYEAAITEAEKSYREATRKQSEIYYASSDETLEKLNKKIGQLDAARIEAQIEYNNAIIELQDTYNNLTVEARETYSTARTKAEELRLLRIRTWLKEN